MSIYDRLLNIHNQLLFSDRSQNGSWITTHSFESTPLALHHL